MDWQDISEQAQLIRAIEKKQQLQQDNEQLMDTVGALTAAVAVLILVVIVLTVLVYVTVYG